MGESAAAVASAWPICLAGEGSTWSEDLRSLIARSVPSAILLGGSPSRVGRRRRATRARRGTVWTGAAPGGAALRAAMAPGVPLLVASSARTDGYLEALGPLEDLQLGSCPCADLDHRVDLRGARLPPRLPVGHGSRPGTVRRGGVRRGIAPGGAVAGGGNSLPRCWSRRDALVRGRRGVVSMESAWRPAQPLRAYVSGDGCSLARRRSGGRMNHAGPRSAFWRRARMSMLGPPR